MTINTINDQKHLTLAEGKIIQKGLESRCRKVDIARTIGKDPSTSAKEIRNHRRLKAINLFIYPSISLHNKAHHHLLQ